MKRRLLCRLRLAAFAPNNANARSSLLAWKVALATHLKATTDVSNRRLAVQLHMGSHFYVSKHVGDLQHGRISRRRGPTAAPIRGKR